MGYDVESRITDLDYESVVANIRRGLQKSLKKSRASGFVFGLSGGVDSAVIAYLCGGVPGAAMVAVIMPDRDVTPKAETEDALLIATELGIEHVLLDIGPIAAEYAKRLEPDSAALGNLRARIRASIVYYYANARRLLVVGSSDRSEYELGYFTKFGDGAADILPIASLYKLQVRRLAERLGVPQRVITKKSSPHLWRGHTAEAELGATYEEVDSVLYLYLDKGASLEDVAAAAGVPEEKAARILQMHKNSEHKRKAAGRAWVATSRPRRVGGSA